jgi:hypothetical protein
MTLKEELEKELVDMMRKDKKKEEDQEAEYDPEKGVWRY